MSDDVGTLTAVHRGADGLGTPAVALPGADPAAEAHAILLAEIEDVDGVVAIDGAAAFLASLPADRWAIVISSPRPLALRRPAAAGRPTPAVLVTADDGERGKPAPECFLLAPERLGQRIEDCLMFEDAPAGIQAGEAAGAAVMVTHRHAVDTQYPTIGSYGELTAGLLCLREGVSDWLSLR